MALQGLVDWRGRPVNQKRHGGVKASMFIHFLIVMANIANIPMILNLVSYLHGTMHMGVKDASTTSTNFFGAICFFSFLGAFVSDSYIKRFYTILIFAPIEIMGYVLLAFQAHLPSLHPPPCDMINRPNECAPVSGRNLSLLTLGLYLIPVGEGSLRSCAAALGGDQFDGDDPAELHGKISFFNWFAFCISLGGFVGLVFLVWVQDNEGWGLSFALAAIMVLVGTVVVSGGLPFYRHQKPTGSPLARIFQVFVAAFRKRKLSLPENVTEMHVATDSTGTSVEFMQRTSDFKFLDKAAVDDGDTRGRSLCTVTQVEEAKIILRMLPIFLSSVLGNVSIPLLLSLTVQQGGTMDTRLGGTSIPPASLFIVPIVFQMLILVAYDRAALPWLRRATGYAGGVTHLQRVGVGFASSVMALAVAAVVEGCRRRSAASAGAPPMSVFWLTPQFFLLGVMDVTSFVGLLEFFYSEASAGMKSIGGAIVFCILGVASWLGSFLIQVVNHATARQGGGHGWLDGANLNASRLDLFYWLLAVFALVSFFLYLLCAWRYTYRHDPRMQAAVDGDKVSPA
ncbi:hypothetical protein PAHAL_3G062500 [Panicum hallii]|uniref:Major facilitator superfamily (MFS) profile domain-containing protein n=1 Tax=Panicum hallii TaxID=206008 RepID=A0A2S3H6X3_9POAL|nr:protein NRT1/ PTR FAMILY 4.3-like [Panicum hallii]PAN16460.1 hypothetical protein PAHAL_3G062500 [Panicum hallii]PAN16461.1 hypothetical protein PAHAL_3G062500 [Panicum hallii]